jgi:hypothetical protein
MERSLGLFPVSTPRFQLLRPWFPFKFIASRSPEMRNALNDVEKQATADMDLRWNGNFSSILGIHLRKVVVSYGYEPVSEMGRTPAGKNF